MAVRYSGTPSTTTSCRNVFTREAQAVRRRSPVNCLPVLLLGTKRDGHASNSDTSQRRLCVHANNSEDRENCHGKTAGIPEHKRHSHVSKHSCAMLMLEGGGKINEVQKRLGHKNGANTLKYLCVSDDAAGWAFQAAVGSF